MSHLCPLQVCKQFSLLTRKSDNRCLFLLPCPGVLCDIASDCFSMFLLLLYAGDVEIKQGPDTRSSALLALESVTTEPSEQMQAIFQILKDVQAHSIQSSKSHAELSGDFKEIKTSQNKIEAKIGSIAKRLGTLEEKNEGSRSIQTGCDHFQGSMETLAIQHDSMQAHLDELEDRSRRNNLIFHGVSDSKESWERSDKHIKRILTSTVDNG